MSNEWVMVPREPDDKMAGGLARDIVMWWCMSPPTGRMLHRHVRALHRDVPKWLADLIPDREVVPPKGAVACAIYRAMLYAAPAAPQQAEPVGYFQRDCDYFEQVEDVYQWDADVIPLYLHPPAAEVQRLREAARLALDALTCGYGDDPDGTHSCGRCDSSVDRNSVARAALRRALEGQ